MSINVEYDPNELTDQELYERGWSPEMIAILRVINSEKGQMIVDHLNGKGSAKFPLSFLTTEIKNEEE